MEFISFDDSLTDEFRQMNLTWVQKYFEVEPADEVVLSDPRKNIIDKGGYIFFGKRGADITCTFALLKITDSEFELSKMAVKEAFLGQNMGNEMLTFCLDQAKKLGIKKLVLLFKYKTWPCHSFVQKIWIF